MWHPFKPFKAQTRIRVEIKVLNHSSQWRFITGVAQEAASRALCAAMSVLMWLFHLRWWLLAALLSVPETVFSVLSVIDGFSYRQRDAMQKTSLNVDWNSVLRFAARWNLDFPKFCQWDKKKYCEMVCPHFCTEFFYLSVNIILETRVMIDSFLSAVLFLYVLCSAISTLFAFVLCTAFIYQHWIEIVLIYRSYLVHNKSTEGKKLCIIFIYSSFSTAFSHVG